jgi:hypothetical protein
VAELLAQQAVFQIMGLLGLNPVSLFGGGGGTGAGNMVPGSSPLGGGSIGMGESSIRIYGTIKGSDIALSNKRATDRLGANT